MLGVGHGSDLEFFNYQKLTDDLARMRRIQWGSAMMAARDVTVLTFPFDLGIEALNDTGSGVHVHCIRVWCSWPTPT